MFYNSKCCENATPAKQKLKKPARPARVKRALRKRGLCDTRFVRAWAAEMHMDISHGHLTRELLCCNGHQICCPSRRPPRINTRPYLLPEEPQLWPHFLENLPMKKTISNKKELDDGWPESVEEQSLLLLVWRHHITRQYIKDVL